VLNVRIQAEQFHRLWVSPGAVAKENRWRYAHIRRGDSTKGLERIGRYVSDMCCLLLCCIVSYMYIITFLNGHHIVETTCFVLLRETIYCGLQGTLIVLEHTVI